MVGIYGITGLPEQPATTPSEPARGRRPQSLSGESGQQGADRITFSPEAQEASAAAKFIEAAKERSEEIRAERIEQARKQLEEGTYRLQQVVLVVAARVANYIGDA
ncbi:MAG: flagellar biosynthesis anti-sigma factor FlgM [Candidatus Hydrogenedentes bacterium]|nr:flagellar biosynthesis anti-sigma factor FlgM [Candidatus Hydrogenedentota bacterium]